MNMLCSSIDFQPDCFRTGFLVMVWRWFDLYELEIVFDSVTTRILLNWCSCLRFRLLNSSMSRYLQHTASDPNMPQPKSMTRPKVPLSINIQTIHLLWLSELSQIHIIKTNNLCQHLCTSHYTCTCFYTSWWRVCDRFCLALDGRSRRSLQISIGWFQRRAGVLSRT